jgi:CheY-like chemotaxis protein
MGSAAQSLPERVVLVVDDEELVCRLTARILADAGFYVLEAHTGAEALALLSSLNGSVQLVVSDIAMPQMTGTELADVAAARWPAVPVLLVSGQGGPPAGYPGTFLPKPFTQDALLETVAGLVGMPERA